MTLPRVGMTEPAAALIERLVSEFRAGLYVEAAMIAQERAVELGQTTNPITVEDAQDAWDRAWSQ